MSKASPDPDFIIRGSDGPITSLRLLDSDVSASKQNALLTGSSSGHVCLWDLSSRRVSSDVCAHEGHPVLWIQSLRDTILTQGHDGKVKTWNVDNGEWKMMNSFNTGSKSFCHCDVIHTSSQSYFAHPTQSTSEIHIIDIQSRHIISKISPTEKCGMVMALKFIRNGQELIAGYEDGSAKIWDLKKSSSDHPLDSLKLHDDTLMCFDFHEDTMKGFSGSVDNMLISWCVDDQSKIKIIHRTELTNDGMNDIVIRADGKIVATAGWDSQIRLFGCKKSKALAVLDGHRESVQCLSFGADNTLVAGGKDKLISFWSVYK